MNNSTFSASSPLFKGVLALHTTSTHNQTLTWDYPLQAQVLSTICCYGLVLNTGEPMNILYIIIPLLLLK